LRASSHDHSYGFINKTPYTRVGTDGNNTAHEIYRTTNYTANSKGAGIKIYGDNGPTGLTNSSGGDILIYGGALRGTGKDGDVKLGYTGSATRGNVYLYTLVSTFVTPSTLTADVNNYAPALGKNYRLSTDGGNYIITGLSLSQVDGMEITIINTGSTGTITISEEDTNSTDVNRFLCVTGASIQLDPKERCDLIYDGTTQRWRAF
jgi:hypothetical protein